jgi:hypothetical protein
VRHIRTRSETGSCRFRIGQPINKQRIENPQPLQQTMNMIQPKILAVGALAAISCVGLMVGLSRHFNGASDGRQTAAELVATTQEHETAPAVEPRRPRLTRNRSLSKPVVEYTAGTNVEAEALEKIVDAKLTLLQDLSTKSDRTSMEAILSEIKSPYPEVRAEAVEAIIQFRSRDAIPDLQTLATEAEDPEEKAAILEAVEFLQLPTLSELRQTMKEISRQKAAAAQATPK